MPDVIDSVEQEFRNLYGDEAWNDWRRLVGHFELGEGFSFLILVLPGAVGTDICRRYLESHLASNGKQLLQISCASRDEVRQLPERLFQFEPTESLGAVWMGSHIPENDPEIDSWRQVWRDVFTWLNHRRNDLLQRFECPLVLVGAPWVYTELRETAPDLWSVRAGVVFIAPDRLSAPGRTLPFVDHGMMQMIQTNDTPPGDPDYALEQADRLIGIAGTDRQRAELLIRAGDGFYQYARFESAQKAYCEAEKLLRSLPQNEDGRTKLLANVLHNHSSTLRQLGHREEALEKVREAVQIYKGFATTLPDAFLPFLAGSLNNLAVLLGQLGKREEALEKAREAVRIYHDLSEARPDTFLPDLAMSLNNLAIRLSDLGNREEALVKIRESVRIRLDLVNTRPDVSLPDLATSINNLAKFLGELGNREEALENARYAVRIFEELAKGQPDAFLPDLAGSLHNLSSFLGELGITEEALEKSRDAVRIFEELAKNRPDAFLPDLAKSQNNLAIRLSGLGHCEEALKKSRDAVRIYQDLAKTRPDTFLPDFALSLNTLANRLSDLGNFEEALEKSREAVRIYQDLATARPDAFLPELAMSFGALGMIHRKMGYLNESVESFRLGMEALMVAFHKSPNSFTRVMSSLRSDYIEGLKVVGQAPDRDFLDTIDAVLDANKGNEG